MIWFPYICVMILINQFLVQTFITMEKHSNGILLPVTIGSRSGTTLPVLKLEWGGTFGATEILVNYVF